MSIETELPKIMSLDDIRYMPIQTSMSYINKRFPEIGGYYAIYSDGYKSFSPIKEVYTLR